MLSPFQARVLVAAWLSLRGFLLYLTPPSAFLRASSGAKEDGGRSGSGHDNQELGAGAPLPRHGPHCVLRFFISKLIRSSPNPSTKAIKEGQAVIRKGLIRSGFI